MPFLIQNPEDPKPLVHPLCFGSNTIGRELDNSIVILDKSLSRHHAELTITGDTYFLKDLGSLNHTYINDHSIERSEIKDRDKIRFGRAECQFLLTLPESFSPPAQESAQEWSIMSRLSLEKQETSLQSLLQSESAQGQDTILKLRPQDAGQRALDKLKILLEVSDQLSIPQPTETLLPKILDLVFQIMSVDRGIILLLDPDTQSLAPAAIQFRAGIIEDPNFYSKTIVSFVQKNGDAIVTSDALRDDRFETSQSILQQAIHASMCVPLKIQTNLIGIIYVDNLSLINLYTREDLEFLTSLANQAAIAIDNSRLYQQIQTEAVMRSKLERFFPQTVRQKLEEKEDSLWEIIDTEVTILFADISNYTQLSSYRSPKEIITLLNEYFTLMVEEIIFPYEGTLEKYVGDALLACWGAPYPQVDDADRAVQAAIAMQKAIVGLNQRWQVERGLEISIHIGINTGSVAAGNIGSRQLIQYAVIGDTTNVSSRICSAAQAGEILLSESTLRKLRSPDLKLEALAPVRVKGKDQPLQLYRVPWQAV